MNANPLNAVNRGVYISDNLPFLKSLNDRCVDLVCIDPPFAKNDTFGRKNEKSPDPLKPPLSDEEKATELALLRRWGIRNEQEANDAGIDWPATRYKDIWSWQDVHESWLKDIEDDHTGVHKLIETTQEIHGDGTAAYLCYMAIRLFEVRRVLKDTGSLYLHCDHTAGAYLRQLLDAIFGKENFRNEIAWRRTNSKNFTENDLGRNHDTILRFSKSDKATYFDRNSIRKPYDLTNGPPNGYRWSPEHNDYVAHAPVHAPGNRQGDSGKPATFRGVTYSPPSSRHWSVPGGRLPNESISEGWARLDQDGLMYIASNGKYPTSLRRLALMSGIAVDDFWPDLQLTSQERTGYPTQKPVALAERIIKASCPEGGVVLDCFAGCAYVGIAAERLGRAWVACDINPRAWTVFKRQFSKPKLAPLKCAEPMPADNVQQRLFGNIVTVHGPGELPARDTLEEEQTPQPFRLPDKPRKFKTPASVIPEREMLDILLGMSGYQAWCCGFANRKPDGSVVETIRNFHLDHMDPVSRPGFSHQITNRAPLCPHHNIMKSNRRLHLAEYREQIAKDGELMVNDVSDLMDLTEAAHRTLNIYASRIPQGGLPL